MTDLCEAAKHGAEFLDEKEPGWEKRVKLTTLDLGDPFSCVLGQLHGSFSHGERHYGFNEAEDARLGFDLDDDVDEDVLAENYRELTACWKDEIRARRTRKETA